jgi:hypothetical protein
VAEKPINKFTKSMLNCIITQIMTGIEGFDNERKLPLGLTPEDLAPMQGQAGQGSDNNCDLTSVFDSADSLARFIGGSSDQSWARRQWFSFLDSAGVTLPPDYWQDDFGASEITLVVEPDASQDPLVDRLGRVDRRTAIVEEKVGDEAVLNALVQRFNGQRTQESSSKVPKQRPVRRPPRKRDLGFRR